MKKVLAILLAATCFYVSGVRVCKASGSRKVTFDQAADCAFITGWELAYEPAATAPPANTAPSATATGFSISNAAPLTCGTGANFTYTALGVGTYRFYLRAVSADGSKSAYSNSVDAQLPFASPVLRSVGP